MAGGQNRSFRGARFRFDSSTRGGSLFRKASDSTKARDFDVYIVHMCEPNQAEIIDSIMHRIEGLPERTRPNVVVLLDAGEVNLAIEILIEEIYEWSAVIEALDARVLLEIGESIGLAERYLALIRVNADKAQ
jgi:hypothetical protein